MAMKELLLSSSNDTLCGKKSVGEIVKAAGREVVWSERRKGNVDAVVVHYMSAINIHRDDPYNMEHIIGIFAEYGVSAHYVIDREGGVYRCVPEDKKAWHAGGSIMPEPDNRLGVNEFSIGIELLATHTSGFTPAQYESLAANCAIIEFEWNRKMSYVGHDMISGDRAVKRGLRKDCKKDPGPLFDWERFSRELESARA